MPYAARQPTPTLPSTARLTEAARHAWTDFFLAAPASLRASLGLHVELAPSAMLLRSTAIPGVLFNRVVGAADPAALDPLLQRARALGPHPFWVQVDAPTSGVLDSALSREGLTRYSRDWVRLARPSGRAPIAETELQVRRASLRDGRALGQLVAEAFGLPREGAGLLTGILDRPSWHPFVAFAGDQLAAAAALFVHDDVGYLALAATAGAWRGRGAQSALIARRLEVAAALGCGWVFSETGEAIAGDPQHSYGNLVRAGLLEAGRVHNFIADRAS